MRYKLVTAFCLMLGLMAPVVHADDDILNDPDAQRATAKLLTLANNVSRQDMGEGAWASYVRKISAAGDDDSSGNFDMNKYLNTELMNIGMAAKSDDIQSIKKVVYWVGLYLEFKAQPPSYVYKLAKVEEADIDDITANFSWERLAQMIKDKAHK